MTAQIHDHVRWNSHDYLLVAIDGPHLFDPVEHGLETQVTTTANWRGWVARYGIEDDRLLLVELHDVGLRGDQWAAPPPLGAVDAQRQSRGAFRYPGLNWPLEFSGRLIAATGFIQDLYRHMGFHPAWKFEQSWELDFDHGTLTDARDLSHEMSERRENIQRGAMEDPDDTNEPGWIARTFRLDPRRSKGR